MARKRRGLSEQPDASKIDPKLRMIANGTTEVNVIRSEYCAGLAVAGDHSLRSARSFFSSGALAIDGQRSTKAPRKGHLKQISRDIRANVFVMTDTADASGSGVVESRRNGNLATATISLSDLPQLSRRPEVKYIAIGQTLEDPKPVVRAEKVGPPAAGVRSVGLGAQHHKGQGVLIGIIDVQGFDFSHPDFLDAQGRTRFIRIWDQGGSGRKPPTGFKDGAELTKDHLDKALRASSAAGVSP